jgi:phenylacetate-coenzyme A ligase PaaK-like adenylate-forming protein
MDELRIEIELTPGGFPETVREELLEDIRGTLGLRPVITIADAGSLPRFDMKARRFFVVQD